MSKFKVGNVVKVIDDLAGEGQHLIGEIGEVVEVGRKQAYGTDYRYTVNSKGRRILANGAELELYRPELLNEVSCATVEGYSKEPKLTEPQLFESVARLGAKKGVSHYAQGMPEGIEPMDIIREQGYAFAFAWGNALKYLCRAQYKGTQLVDLKKAQDYLSEAIATLESEAK